ncbi:MAG: transglycosylase domain-containing protein [Aeromicrobium sp.]|uniref:transglycosylase domain-containing protein n=1 Tax=Aeromicrobium sp. TaxID=1871063 RepID=UPI0026179662|nr:transglycosylase domain-containing protein [Aeromicrobium sp.]MDF1706120.1 transglycosylase domain-containing protein [Aeromicrobium sp.]
MARSNKGSGARRTARRGGIFAIFRGIGGEGRAWWVKTLRWFAFLSVAGFATGALAFFIIYRSIDIPDPNAEFQTQTTKVYFSDGTTQLGEFAEQDRENVDLDQVPASMQAAVIAAEDRSFYTNRGIDFKGIVRALRDNTTSGRITGGASTITQQYVKILYLTQERTYTRKVKEAVLSLKIHNQLSKSEILEGYLNTVYYGNGAYGVQVAAKTYFGKDVTELTVPESAFLATVLNSPTYYDPYTPACLADAASAECQTETADRDARVLPRYNYVLDGMEKSGAITAEEADQFTGVLPAFSPVTVSNRYAGPNGYLLKMVENDMAKQDFSDSQVQGGGLRIVTTIDPRLQQAAVDAVDEVAPKNLEGLHTGLASIQPGTGAVKALYGGPDFLADQFNWATAKVQPGSTFKMFAVVAALEDGFSLKTQLNGNTPYRIGGGSVKNAGDSGGASYGTLDLERATAKSVNTAFVDLTVQMSDGGDVSVGAQKILDAAVQAGIPQSTIGDNPPVAVTSLGYFGVAPIDMANAYATVAAGGKKAPWYVVQKVSSAEGSVLYEHTDDSEQAVPSDVAADTLAALQGVTGSGGTGTAGRTVCPTAGKTGTATAGPDGDTFTSAVWFVGATPKLATAVMYSRGDGNDKLDGFLRPAFGGAYPAQTFKAYMNQAVDADDCGSFPKPANIKSDKGEIFTPPPPSCSPAEQLNADQTACEPRPVPQCDPNTQKLDGTGFNCVPITCEDSGQTGTFPDCVDPSPTPTPSPTGSTPPAGNLNTQARCQAAGGTWVTTTTPPSCRLP